MATALNLFPARIRFVNEDGTLTPEAFRALQTLMVRVGGPIGDNGVDVFGDQTGTASIDSSISDTVTQQVEQQALMEAIAQPLSVDVVYPDIAQPTAIGINTTITSALLVGKTITVQDGLITGFI